MKHRDQERWRHGDDGNRGGEKGNIMRMMAATQLQL